MNTEIEVQSEPLVEDLLRDSVLLAVLERDGLTVDDVKAVIADYHRQIEDRDTVTH
ncbi:MAG: hypothetical protein JJ879_10410 [Sneathiella sp.]|nr:hypothetical protein [Sneathiella sp.]